MLMKALRSIDGLVGYDAALTRLRSRVRFPLDVFLANRNCFVLSHHYDWLKRNRTTFSRSGQWQDDASYLLLLQYKITITI